MSEKRERVFGEVPVGDEIVELRGENVTLYRHLGNYAVFDHMFVRIGEDSGAYLWRTHTQFHEFATLAVDHDALLVLNIPEVSPADEKAYMGHNLSDLEDTIPEGWL